MTSLEEDARFAAALDECRRRMQRGETLKLCLADYPEEYRDELAHLAPMAARLGRCSRDPSPEFQGRLKARLLASVDEARRGQRSGLLGRFGRLFAAGSPVRSTALTLIALVFLIGSGAGIVQASAGSLPDSPLYQVKTAREWVELTLARNEEARLDAQTRQIDERGRELERAARDARLRRSFEAVANRLIRSTEQMVDQALEKRAQGNPRPSLRALATIRAMQNRLDQLSREAPPEVRPLVERLHNFLDRQERRLLERGDTIRSGRGA